MLVLNNCIIEDLQLPVTIGLRKSDNPNQLHRHQQQPLINCQFINGFEGFVCYNTMVPCYVVTKMNKATGVVQQHIITCGPWFSIKESNNLMIKMLVRGAMRFRIFYAFCITECHNRKSQRWDAKILWLWCQQIA